MPGYIQLCFCQWNLAMWLQRTGMPEFAGMAPRECQEMFSLEGMAWTFGRYLRIVRMKFLGTYQVNTRSGAGAKEEDATLPAANKATNTSGFYLNHLWVFTVVKVPCCLMTKMFLERKCGMAGLKDIKNVFHQAFKYLERRLGKS